MTHSPTHHPADAGAIDAPAQAHAFGGLEGARRGRRAGMHGAMLSSDRIVLH